MYIKINDSDVHYNATISPLKTQSGNSAVKVMGMPETDKGFKVYDKYDNVISDFSDYIYIYKENVYTTVDEKYQSASISFQPIETKQDNIYSNLSKRISDVAVMASVTANSLAETNDALCEYTTDNDERVGELEDSFCEYTTDTDIRIGDVEDSLCELSENEESEE